LGRTGHGVGKPKQSLILIVVFVVILVVQILVVVFFVVLIVLVWVVVLEVLIVVIVEEVVVLIRVVVILVLFIEGRQLKRGEIMIGRGDEGDARRSMESEGTEERKGFEAFGGENDRWRLPAANLHRGASRGNE
jgi:hypothetical protein